MTGWRLVAGGDFCHARVSQTHPFDRALQRVIERADLSIVNLEAPIADRETPAVKSGPVLRIPVGRGDVLSRSGFGVFGMANNHIMDHGADGLGSTLETLAALSVRGVGAGLDESGAYQALMVEVSGIRVAVLAGCEREFGVAEGNRAGVAALDHPRFGAALQHARANADVVVVMAHGGLELAWIPPPHWRARLRGLAAAGADVVIGHHPHVLQGVERVGRSLVGYSLGDCYWPLSGGRSDPRRNLGLLLEVEFRGATLENVRVLTVVLGDDHQARLLDGDRARTAENARHRLEALMADEVQYGRLWEALAVRTFHQRYEGHLLGGAKGARLVRHLLRHQTAGLLAARRALTGASHPRLTTQVAYLLNCLQNESHRDVCARGLRAILEGRDSGEYEGVGVDMEVAARSLEALGADGQGDVADHGGH